MPLSKKMRRSSTTRHRQRSSSSSEYPCDALDIFYDASTTKAQKRQKKRRL